MTRFPCERRRFSQAVIQHAVWLYFRFMPSLSDAEEILAHRGIDVSYETIRYWTTKFGPKSAANLRRRKLPPPPRWHLDEMVSTIAGERVWIWRTVDDEDEVMDMIVQKQRSDLTAACLLRRLLKNQNVEPQRIVTDEHRSWGAALERPGLSERHHLGRLRHNTRTRNSHLTIRRRDWKMQGFKKIGNQRGASWRRMPRSATRSICSAS